jgi:YesN/AraC family two-component response regulator
MTYANDLKIYGKKIKLLIVDDEESIRELLKKLLIDFFYKIDTACDGADAIEKYKNNKYDLVITDYEMPNKNGVDFAKEIKSMNRNQIIVVISAYFGEFVVDFLNMGVSSFIKKPLDLESFMLTLLTHCENIIFKRELDRVRLNKNIQKENILYSKSPVKSIAVEIAKSNNTKEKEIKPTVKKYSEDRYLIDKISKNINEDINISEDISEDISELNSDFEDLIGSILLYGMIESHVESLSEILNKYYTTLYLLDIENMGFLLKDFADSLYDVDINNINKDSVIEMIEFLYDDIIEYFNNIFTSNRIQNIDYLIDSMRSSLYQIKIELKIENIKEDDDIELF